jgi:hypothetical protein
MRHRVPDRVAHLPHLTVASLSNGDDQRGAVLAAASARTEHDLRGTGRAAVDGDTARQPIEVARVGDAQDARFVDPRDAVPRMREPGGEVAVVGQQQQPLRIEVEPPDG